MALPQREPVRMACREIADVEPRPCKARKLDDLSFAQEPLGDATLIEDLDAAGVQSAGARLNNRLIGAPFDDRDVDMRERELRGQHQAGRAATGDNDRMAGACCAFCTRSAARRGRRKQ